MPLINLISKTKLTWRKMDQSERTYVFEVNRYNSLFQPIFQPPL